MRIACSRPKFPFFRSRLITWGILLGVCWSWLPVASLAQPPAVQILSLQGTARINGQPAAQGTALKAGDVIETQAGASLVLALSDQSQIEIGESTQFDVAELLAADTSARTSRLKLAYGWVRAKLSPDYNKGGDAKFEIETPNALVGVKFSPPDTRVDYDPAKKETVAKGLTNELDVLNKLTSERITAPVGATVTITDTAILVAGAASLAKTLAVSALIGSAAAGGILALQPDSKEEEPEWSFAGIFKASIQEPALFGEKIVDLTQTGSDLKGSFSFNERKASAGVTVVCQRKIPVKGSVTETNRAKVDLATPYVRCSDGFTIYLPTPLELKLTDNGNTLVITNPDLKLELKRM